MDKITERKGLSSDCKLPPTAVMAILMGGSEHPCDRCNIDRKKCRGYPRKDEQALKGQLMSTETKDKPSETELEKAAKKAARTGNRRDLREYLRLRRIYR